MSTVEDDLNDFAEYARRRLAENESQFSLDELFDLWRLENPSGDLYAENVSAIKVAIDDLDNGDRGTPAGEHSAQLRREFGIEPE